MYAFTGSESERFFKLRKASEAVLKYDPEKGDFPARVARTKSTEWISDFTKLPPGFVSEDSRRVRWTVNTQTYTHTHTHTHTHSLARMIAWTHAIVYSRVARTKSTKWILLYIYVRMCAQ